MINNMKDYWDNRAEAYDEHVLAEIKDEKERNWLDLFAPYSPNVKDKTLLDLGTGPGFFSLLFAKQGANVVAVDHAENMLKMARKNLTTYAKNAKFIQADIENCEFNEKSFDFIVMRNVSWMLKFPSQTYKKWQSWLKNGGKLMIVDANWYGYLNDDCLAKKMKDDFEAAREFGFKQNVSDEEAKSCENMARNITMTYAKRPEFDEALLKSLNFSDIKIERDIDFKVYNKGFQRAYETTRSFLIVASK